MRGLDQGRVAVPGSDGIGSCLDSVVSGRHIRLPDKKKGIIRRWKVCWPRRSDLIISVRDFEKVLAEALLELVRPHLQRARNFKLDR